MTQRADHYEEIPELDVELIEAEEGWSTGIEIEVADELDLSPETRAQPDGPSGEVEAALSCDVSVPPERVRFTAAASLCPDDSDEQVDAAVLNLSKNGAAVCADSLLLSCGDRAWLSFSLALGAEPIELACEVIWTRSEQGRLLHGLRFLDISAEVQQEISRVVSERAEGITAEWPVPMATEQAATPPRQPSAWMSAAAGMAAGIGLALALSAIPNVGITKPEPVKAIEQPAVTASEEPSVEARVETRGGEVRDVAGRVSSAVSTDAERGSAVEQQNDSTAAAAIAGQGPIIESTEPPIKELGPVAEEPRNEAAQSSAESRRKEKGLLPRREPSTPQEDNDVLRPLGDEDGVHLALLTDGPVQDHVSFWLQNPRRLVVDVFGRTSAFARRDYVIDHPLAKGLRVGQHPGKVRFVIETSEKAGNQVVTRPEGNALVVEIAPR